MHYSHSKIVSLKPHYIINLINLSAIIPNKKSILTSTKAKLKTPPLKLILPKNFLSLNSNCKKMNQLNSAQMNKKILINKMQQAHKSKYGKSVFKGKKRSYSKANID